MSTKAEQVIEFGRAVRREQQAWDKAAVIAGGSAVYSTKDVHKALAIRGVFANDEQAKKGWTLLAKLAFYQYPGVRIGAETESAWKGQKRLVRPKEWHAAPTGEEMVAWEDKVRGHRSAMASVSLGKLEKEIEVLTARVEWLETHMKRLLAPDNVTVAQ